MGCWHWFVEKVAAASLKPVELWRLGCLVGIDISVCLVGDMQKLHIH